MTVLSSIRLLQDLCVQFLKYSMLKWMLWMIMLCFFIQVYSTCPRDFLFTTVPMLYVTSVFFLLIAGPVSLYQHSQRYLHVLVKWDKQFQWFKAGLKSSFSFTYLYLIQHLVDAYYRVHTCPTNRHFPPLQSDNVESLSHAITMLSIFENFLDFEITKSRKLFTHRCAF